MITVFSKWVNKYLDDRQFKVVEIIQSAFNPNDFIFVYKDDPIIRKALEDFRRQTDYPSCANSYDLTKNIC